MDREFGVGLQEQMQRIFYLEEHKLLKIKYQIFLFLCLLLPSLPSLLLPIRILA